jgi:hypothetical protein
MTVKTHNRRNGNDTRRNGSRNGPHIELAELGPILTRRQTRELLIAVLAQLGREMSRDRARTRRYRARRLERERQERRQRLSEPLRPLALSAPERSGEGPS